MSVQAQAVGRLSEEDLARLLRRVLALVGAGLVGRFREYRALLEEAAEDFLAESAEDLARWSGLLAAGAITPGDYESLTRTRSAIARLEALSLAGMSRGEVARFRGLLVESVVGAALAVVLGR